MDNIENTELESTEGTKTDGKLLYMIGSAIALLLFFALVTLTSYHG